MHLKRDMNPMMKQAKIHEMFSDEKFERQRIETIWASTQAHNEWLRLIVVVIPSKDLLCYRVERDGITMHMTHTFKTRGTPGGEKIIIISIKVPE